MKPKILTALLLTGFLCTFAQDNKPTLGDVGIHYGVNFNGAVQQFIGVSGVITKNLELGGVLSFSYTHTNNSTSDSSYAEGISGSLRAISTSGTKNTSYSVGISPYLLYHFPIHSNLDLYVGPIISVGFSNNNSHAYNMLSALNYMQSQDNLTSQPASVNMGVGILLGCQYFFYKNLALGVQAGLMAGYSITSGNKVDITTTTNSGSDNSINSTTSFASPLSTEKDRSFNLSTAASAGVSLAFYFSRKAK